MGEDISLSQEIIFGNNVLFEGNGHSLDITSANGYGFYIDGKKGISIANLELNFQSDLYYRSEGVRIAASEVDISAIKINNTDINGLGILDQGGYGVMGYAKSKINIDSIAGINADVILGEGDMPNVEGLFSGEANTQAIIDEIGSDALAASAANQFYVGEKEGDFGQGTWYLPAIGEWMDLYGTDIETATKGSLYGTTGANGDNFEKVQEALTTLAGKTDSEGNTVAEVLKTTNANGDKCWYWSSSEWSSLNSWVFSPSDGYRTHTSKNYNNYVRCFQLLENCFNPSGGNIPQIGDVMYDDKTWSSAENYDNSKTAVGIVCGVNDDGSVKIINLKDLRFSSATSTNNFDPDNPYSGSVNYSRYSTGDNMYENIDDVHDFYGYINPNDNITITGEVRRADAATAQEYSKIINQYDKMIQDTSYQGINLLQNGQLKVTLNESRTHEYTISGKNMGSDGVGLVSKNWEYTNDIQNSINELTSAINTIRSFQEELGTHYQVIQTRQNFTSALSDVLETGADDLVLADMNEASAEYLMLQTRQQLATNSLSLAAQSAQSILKLF